VAEEPLCFGQVKALNFRLNYRFDVLPVVVTIDFALEDGKRGADDYSDSGV
jgi:hypothetical protein